MVMKYVKLLSLLQAKTHVEKLVDFRVKIRVLAQGPRTNPADFSL
jgi:hypothetical protein